jgi:hypothetical protein
MRIMESRHQHLIQTLDGLDRSGVPLVRFDGHGFYATGQGDDLGGYYVIPKIAQWLDLPIELALDAFYYSLVAVAVVSAIVGFGFYLRSWTSRAVAAACVAYSGYLISTWNDVYLIGPCLVMGLVPWILAFARKNRHAVAIVAFAVLVGVLVATGNVLRSHAGTSVLLFTVVLMVTNTQFAWRRRALFMLALVAGLMLPSGYFRWLLHERDAFLLSQNASYQPAGKQHAFWHPVYLGLGFLRNPYNLAYDDSVAMKAVSEVNPQIVYLSAEYSATLRQLVLDLYERDATFVWRTLFAKLGILVYYILRYANLGLLAAWLSPKGWRCDLAFAAGISFSALFGVLVVPEDVYLLSLHVFAGMFAAASLGHFIDSPPAWPRVAASRFGQWLAARPRLLRSGSIALRFALILLALNVVEKKFKSARHAIAGVVQQSWLDGQRPLVLRLAKEGQMLEHWDLDEIPWKTLKPEVELTPQDETFTLKTGTAPYDFQVEAEIPADSALGTHVGFSLEVHQGGVAIGLLNSQYQWADLKIYHQPGVYQDELAAYVAGASGCKLIVTNWNAQSQSSQCTLKAIDVRNYSPAGDKTPVAAVPSGSSTR